MNILLKSARILDPHSDFNSETKDIFISNGTIQSIGKGNSKADKVIEFDGLCVSPGWMDLRCQMGDPGYEYRETIQSTTNAAAAGGFTDIVCSTNSNPTPDTKNDITFIKNSQLPAVDLHPLGSLTIKTEGKELCELLDLHEAGAVGFSDGVHPIWHSGILQKGIEYLQIKDVPLIAMPLDKALSELGQVHEGEASTKVGLKGIPSVAEEIVVARDLDILRYSGGRLHFTTLSTAKSVELIRAAKKEGLNVTCDIAAYQLSWTDEDMVPFDTNYKVLPPLRSAEDAKALKKGVLDGTIDAIVSNHLPYHSDEKEIEFDQAEFGIIGLQTAFSSILEALGSDNIETIVERMSAGPRKVLKQAECKIEEGGVAKLTLFNTEQNWSYTTQRNKSQSVNSPFLGKELKGVVFGTINGGNLSLNEG